MKYVKGLKSLFYFYTKKVHCSLCEVCENVDIAIDSKHLEVTVLEYKEHHDFRGQILGATYCIFSL